MSDNNCNGKVRILPDNEGETVIIKKTELPNEFTRRREVALYFFVSFSVAILGVFAFFAYADLANNNNSRAATRRTVDIVHHDPEMVRQWRELVAKLEARKDCGLPQLRCVSIEPIPTDPEARKRWPEFEYLPQCAPVFRCEPGMACCEESDADCGPAEQQDIGIEFKRKRFDSKEDYQFVTMPFKNHTKCGCVLPGGRVSKIYRDESDPGFFRLAYVVNYVKGLVSNY